MPLGAELQAAIEPGFFWLVVAAAVGTIWLAVLKSIELLTRNRKTFEESAHQRHAEKAIEDLLK